MSKMLTTPNINRNELVRLVQERLAPYQPIGSAMEVLPEAVHQEGQWWYVVVPPGQIIANASDYNRRVEKVERDLKRLDHINVSILPVIPEWLDTLK